nr:acyltransferase [Dyella sp. ASV24]
MNGRNDIALGQVTTDFTADDASQMRHRRAHSPAYLNPKKIALLIMQSKNKDVRTLRDTIESHNNNYTLVRLILAASVIYFHSFALSPGLHDHLSIAFLPVTTVGGLAVQLFFFLSGLFVAQSFNKDPHVPSFILKRFMRIWPGLFVCLLVTSIIIAVINKHPTFLQYLKFDQFYDYTLRNSVFDLTWYIDGLLKNNASQSLNGSIHTLPMEAKMYVVLAFIGALDMARTPARLAIAGAIAFVAVVVPGIVELLPITLLNADYSRAAAAMFLAGVCVYGLSARLRIRLWQGILLITGAVVSTGIAHVFLFYASAAWIMMMIGQSPLIGKLWRPKQDLSYGIYIYGWPSQQIIMALAPIHLTAYVLTLIAVPLSTAFASLSWRFVEKPSIKFGKDFAARANAPTLKKHRRVLIALATLLAALVGARAATHHWTSAPVQTMHATIANFGPQESRAGEPINLQPNGESAIWITTDGGPAPDGTMIVMDGHYLSSQIAGNVVTARVDPSILATSGEKPIFLERRYADRIERSNQVELKVR